MLASISRIIVRYLEVKKKIMPKDWSVVIKFAQRRFRLESPFLDIVFCFRYCDSAGDSTSKVEQPAGINSTLRTPT